MAFTRENLTGATDGSGPVNYPDFSLWDRDTVSAGMQWNLAENWVLKVDSAADGGALKFELNGTDQMILTSEGLTVSGKINYEQWDGAIDGGTF